MKKDIEIPLVKDVFVAAILQENKEFNTQDWNAYLINDKRVPIEMVLMVSQGFDRKKTTSIMRHRLNILPAKSFAKIEFLETGILGLDNRFSISFLKGESYSTKNLCSKKTVSKKKPFGNSSNGRKGDSGRLKNRF